MNTFFLSTHVMKNDFGILDNVFFLRNFPIVGIFFPVIQNKNRQPKFITNTPSNPIKWYREKMEQWFTIAIHRPCNLFRQLTGTIQITITNFRKYRKKNQFFQFDLL